MNKFEKLIEFVINDEHDKARELFHDIVVEKSRTIYEDLMAEEEEEFSADEESAEEFDDEGEEEGEEEEESGDDDFGSDDEEFGDEEFGDDEEDEGSLEDRVVDLEDQLDELMSEFEALMSDEEGEEDFGMDDELGGDEADEFDDELGGDDFGMDDDMGDEDFADDGMDMMAENVDLMNAPKPVTSEEGWVGKKSPNANNSGAIGAVAKPVPAGSDTAKGGSAPKVGELIGKVQNTVGGDKKLSPAPKPVTSQASGTNTVTPFPKV